MVFSDEGMMRAAGVMRDAAEQMERAASSIQWTFDQFTRRLEEMVAQITYQIDRVKNESGN